MLLVPALVALGFVASFLALGGSDDRLSGPPLPATMEGVPAPRQMTADLFLVLEPGELTDALGLEVLDAICGRSQTDRPTLREWVGADESEFIRLIACRTDSSLSANNVPYLQLRLFDCPVREDRIGETDYIYGPIICPIAGDGSAISTDVRASMVVWNEADVALVATVSGLDEPDRDAWQWIDDTSGVFSAAGYQAPLFRNPTQVAGAVGAFGLLAFAGLQLVRFVVRVLRTKRHRLDGTATVSTARRAGDLRWMSRFLGVLQGGAFVLLPLTFLATFGPLATAFPFQFGPMIPTVVYVAAVAAATAYFRRFDGGRSHLYRSGFGGPTVAALYGLALAALVVGVGLYAALSAGSAFPIDWRDDLPEAVADPLSTAAALLFVAGLVPLASLALTTWLLRRARRRRAATVDDLDQDPTETTLFLRSFDDDDLLLPAGASPRRGLLDAWTIRATDRFEEIVSWELAAQRPMVAVSDRSALGAARIEVASDQWQDWVRNRQDAAPLIVVVVGGSDGLGWEIEQIIRRGHLHKTLFIMPPVPTATVTERWQWLQRLFIENGRPLTIDGQAAGLTFVVGPDGSVTTVSADRRDEAGYRSAIEYGSMLATAGA